MLGFQCKLCISVCGTCHVCRPWYVAAATIKINIVIAIDLADGMKPYLYTAKRLAEIIINSTKRNDKVG